MAGPSATKFATIRYPAEAKFATVHVAVDAGTITVRSAAAGREAVERVVPLSPVYNLNNAASGGNVVIPLGVQDAVPEVVAVTAVNDSTRDGLLTVVVGVSHLPEATQQQLNFTLTVPANGGSAFAHLVFHKLD
jgi:hypothetical protein